MFSKQEMFLFTYFSPYISGHCQWIVQCKTSFNIINLKFFVHILLCLQCKINQWNFPSLFHIKYEVQIWLYLCLRVWVCLCVHAPEMASQTNHYTENWSPYLFVLVPGYFLWDSLSPFCFWFWQRWQLNCISVI